MPVSSEHVSDLLPEYAESGLRPAGEVEEHLASCVACSAELGTYRSLLSSLAAFRAVEIEPPPGYLERTIRTVRVASVTSRIRSLADLKRTSSTATGPVARAPRVGYALASLGGAAVGASA